MTLGFDVAGDLTFAQDKSLRGLGYGVACGYYRLDPADPTQQSDASLRWRLGLGFAFLPIFEFQPGNLSEPVGEQEGAAARARAEERWQPYGTPILFARGDYDFPAADAPKLLDYVNGLDVGLGRRCSIWLYGPWDLIEAAGTWPAVAGFLQAYAPAWSGGRNAQPHPLAAGFQYPNGVTVAGVGTIDLQRWRGTDALWRVTS